jgi:hypothetical protein
MCRSGHKGEHVKNGKTNGLMSYERLHELLQMTALQTSENAKQMHKYAREFQWDLKKSREEHNREMKEIRGLFKQISFPPPIR